MKITQPYTPTPRPDADRESGAVQEPEADGFDPRDQMMEPSDQLNRPSEELMRTAIEVTPCHAAPGPTPSAGRPRR